MIVGIFTCSSSLRYLIFFFARYRVVEHAAWFSFFLKIVSVLNLWDRCGRKGSVFELEWLNTYSFKYAVVGFDMLTGLRNKLHIAKYWSCVNSQVTELPRSSLLFCRLLVDD